jgi:hypothetical protein
LGAGKTDGQNLAHPPPKISGEVEGDEYQYPDHY